jgi:hypothetical protein
MYEPESKWIAFIDVDEYLFCKEDKDVRFLLSDYEDYGGLGVHWVEYGSSGHINRPGKSQLGNFCCRFPLDYAKNMHVKSIVQPERVQDTYNPHIFLYKDPWYCVDEEYHPLTEPQGPFTAKRIQLNHYYYRSQNDFFHKVDRGRADREDERGKRDVKAFYWQLNKANIYDDSALKHAKSVALILGQKHKLKEVVAKRKQDRNKRDEYIKSSLRYISEKKFTQAERLIKRLKVCLVDKKIIYFIQAKLYRKKEDQELFEEHINKSLSEGNSLDIYVEYITFLIEQKRHSKAKNILLYIKWRFAYLFKENSEYKKMIDNLSESLCV